MPVAEADVADALFSVSGNIPQFFPLQAFLWALKGKVLNISHLQCGPVGVRFIESRFAGRHKCRPYKNLKRKFLYY